MLLIAESGQSVGRPGGQSECRLCRPE